MKAQAPELTALSHRAGLHGPRALTIGAGAIILLAGLPLLSLARFLAGSDGELWHHLIRNVLPFALRDTALLVAGVALLCALFGVTLAALVSFCEFPFRRIVEWAAVLPLAFPVYLSAYIHVEIFDAAGPVRSLWRTLTGRDGFPEIRSLPGACLIFALVLYPYVYLPVRIAFTRQTADYAAAARTLGYTAFETFWRISLPLARPALMGGIALALMEALSDIGASEYLGVRSLAVTVYATWLARGSLTVAGQLAIVLLIAAIALIGIERALRGRALRTAAMRRHLPPSRAVVGGWRGIAVLLIALVPILLGFVIPFLFLVNEALGPSASSLLDAGTIAAAWSSAALAFITALIVCVAATWLALWQRHDRRTFVPPLVTAAGYGYALPSVVLALCVLVPAGLSDNWLNALIRATLNINPGLPLTSLGAVLVYAYVIRFLAVGIHVTDAGLRQTSQNVEYAARSLGQSFAATARRITLPLISSSLFAALALVFLDTMKELPLTLLLRPLGIETLATSLYGNASRGSFEDGAIEALLIALAGLASVFVLWRVVGAAEGQRQSK